MAGFNDYAEDEILDHVFGGGDYSRPATLYMAALKSAAADDDDGSTISEADFTDYARVAITNNATNFPAASGGAKSNGTEIAFPEAGAGSNNDLTHWALLDSGTLGAGNIIIAGAFDTTKNITDGDTLRIPVGDLDITLD